MILRIDYLAEYVLENHLVHSADLSAGHAAVETSVRATADQKGPRHGLMTALNHLVSSL